jgi:KaiC/GvpD/RAD55 family RecA-like ATPase
MKKIFRSILNVKKKGSPTIPPHELVKNYREFLASRIEEEDPSYIKMYEWIEAHYREFKEIPSYELLYEKAQEEGEETILVNLKEIAPLIPYWGGDYRAILKEKYEEQSQDGFRSVVENTWKIAHSGMKVKKGRGKKELKGIHDAVSYFSSGVKDFLYKKGDVKTEGQVISPPEGKEVIAEYEKRKKDPFANLGLLTQLNKIDEVFRGIKLGDLFLIAAFVGQAKTTLAVNLAYNGVSQGLNGLFVTMEMTFSEMRDMINVLHTCNPYWYDVGKYSGLTGKVSYSQVRYGELDKKEEEFFKVAVADLGTRSDFGELLIFQPDEHLTPSRFEMELYNYKAELEERNKKLDFVVLDYVGLMIQDKESRYGDFNVDLNNIIKRLKNIGINFDDGRGLRIITPFQVNREGWKEASKNDGVYKLTALSNAHEAERSSDGVIALYTTEDMKKTGALKICCLKHRDGENFSPFEAHVDFVSKAIRDFTQSKEDSPNDSMSINPIENISDDVPLGE